ncbi:MAG: MASE1 domain-containing protein [Alphaproteobacteria bacterium]|nr:MASE1 domain-containing protein [Alphaproteobacteria bacterium]MDE2112251.1 MASE1 domain-containing protein [Alphaproteobacteria bacterium]MDE2495519.1 MASE1 domain-containing protein [Alphaproteobacteria bacterium]
MSGTQPKTSPGNAHEKAQRARIYAFARNDLVWLVIFAAALALASWASIRMTQHSGRIAAIWLTNAVVLVTLFKTETKRWAQFALVAFVANVVADRLSGDSMATACVLSFANLAEIFVVAAPMRRLKRDADIRNLRSLATFMALALGPATLLSAALAAGYLATAQGASFIGSLTNWYAADAFGLILVVPIAMLVKRSDILAIFKPDQLLGTAASVAVLGLVFAAMIAWPTLPFGFLLFPCILLLAFQQGYAGVAMGLALITAVMLSNLLLNHGFLSTSHAPLREKIFFLQFFVVMLTATMLIVAAALFEKKRMERRLREVTKSAIEARREAHRARLEADKANQTKSQFLANMSHELRTPLNAILGFSDIIRGGLPSTKCTGKCPEHAEYIHNAGSHLLDLVSDILDASKIEAGKYDLYLQHIDLAVAVRDAAALVAHRAVDGGVALRIEEPKKPLLLLLDQRAVKQIMLNLLSNAVKFTPSGGSITVTVREEHKGALVVVEDSGIGIPKSELSRLGKPFERVRSHASRAQPGTGLGLALVRSLAELHGGHMKIDSIESVGTTVSVYFPARADSAAA